MISCTPVFLFVKLGYRKTNFQIHTNSDICGANMEPIRPNMEAMPNSDIRNSVGNISAVNTYMVLNAMVMAYLLLKNNSSFIHK